MKWTCNQIFDRIGFFGIKSKFNSQLLFQQSRLNEIFIQEENPQVLLPWPIAIACQFE